MKNIFVIIFTLFFIFQGYCYKYPNIATSGKIINDFVPIGWMIRDTIIGDFNKDSLNDFVIIIETKQQLIIEDTECFSTQPYFPKMLIVLLGKHDKTLKLTTIATKLFGNCNWGVQGADPFEKIEERRNTLGITFLTGGTMRYWQTYYFRLQNNDWFLIGAESFQYWAGHTEGKEAYYYEKLNLITGLRESYNEDQNRKQNNYKKTSFETKSLIKLTDFNYNTVIPFIENN